MGLDQWVLEVKYPQKFKEYLANGFKINNEIYMHMTSAKYVDELRECIDGMNEVCYWRKCYPVQSFLEDEFGEMDDCQYYVMSLDVLEKLYKKSKTCVQLLEPYFKSDINISKNISKDIMQKIHEQFSYADPDDLPYLYTQLVTNLDGLKKCITYTKDFYAMFVYHPWW